LGPCRSCQYVPRGGGIHGYIVASSRAGAAGAGGRGQSQLGGTSNLPRHTGHQPGRRGIQDPENRWPRRDCTEYQDELDWMMRTFRRVCDELDLSSMPAKMRRVACAREDRINLEYQRDTRVVERLLQAHGGRPETGHLPAGNGCRDEQKCRDEFNIKGDVPRRGWSTRTLFPWTGGPPCL
jgi:hypothetical protein